MNHNLRKPWKKMKTSEYHIYMNKNCILLIIRKSFYMHRWWTGYGNEWITWPFVYFFLYQYTYTSNNKTKYNFDSRKKKIVCSVRLSLPLSNKFSINLTTRQWNLNSETSSHHKRWTHKNKSCRKAFNVSYTWENKEQKWKLYISYLGLQK
jgi:hypothetical protein